MRPRPLRRVSAPQQTRPEAAPAPGSLPPGLGFSCEACGSPSILLPQDLQAQSLVVCDHCHRPVATLAEFRELVDRLLGCATQQGRSAFL